MSVESSDKKPKVVPLRNQEGKILPGGYVLDGEFPYDANLDFSIKKFILESQLRELEEEFSK